MAGIRGCSLLRAPGLGPPPCTQDSARLPPLYQNQAASSISKAMTYQDCALPLHPGLGPPLYPGLGPPACLSVRENQNTSPSQGGEKPLNFRAASQTALLSAEGKAHQGCTRVAPPLSAENCLLCGCLLPAHVCLPGHLLPWAAHPPGESNTCCLGPCQKPPPPLKGGE